jgi:HAD domain in Swiss Army Knife RNA repair proteins
MRVIFLDFDGVLNSHPFLKSQSKAKVYTESGAIDPVNVKRLNRLVSETGAKVVISSSWRHGRTLGWLVGVLEECGFEHTFEVIGKTPTFVPNNNELSKRSCGERGDEIQDWMDRAHLYGYDEIDSFVILDDNSDMSHLKDRLAQTDFDAGITDARVDKAIELLSKPLPKIALPDADTIVKFSL